MLFAMLKDGSDKRTPFAKNRGEGRMKGMIPRGSPELFTSLGKRAKSSATFPDFSCFSRSLRSTQKAIAALYGECSRSLWRPNS